MSNTENTMATIETPAAVAEYLNIPVTTLTEWRYQKRGPRYIKVGRLVRYRREDVEQWLQEQTVEVRRAVA